MAEPDDALGQTAADSAFGPIGDRPIQGILAATSGIGQAPGNSFPGCGRSTGAERTTALQECWQTLARANRSPPIREGQRPQSLGSKYHHAHIHF